LRNEILDILTGARLDQLFTTIVAAGDTPQSKPSPAPYMLAYERLVQITALDLDRRRCVAIEDSRWGLESARGAGLRLVGVTSSYKADELKDAELITSGLAALTIEALDRLCKDAQAPR
jgi:beta-phosphoglucomutase-like phosphatase (HAD superfamily)